MPFDNLSDLHFTDDEKRETERLLVRINQLLAPKIANLNADDRTSFGKVSETNKLIVNKVKDYLDHHPELASTDVDWGEFLRDYEDRTFLQNLSLSLQSTMQSVENTRIAHDYDNYQASLNDYDYSTFKLRKNPAFEIKVRELKQFFSRSGTGGTTNDPKDPPAPDTDPA